MSIDPDDTILKSLNNAQRRAVVSKASTVAILAGPGSGKTHTLTSRVVWLIKHAGYQPCNVIVATFTVKAAREMKERIGKILGEEIEKKIVLGTFHSISRRYLSTYGKRIGLDFKFNIADDGDSRAIIKRICERHKLTVEPSYARSWISKKKAQGTGNAVPQKKDNEHRDLKTCYKEYQEHLERSNLLDYDDLLVKCVELLQQHPSCVANVQAVLIDEYQDTNGIQYELMKLFAQKQQRITVVGDPDQSIYGWRSAEVRNLYRLLREFPGTDEISLEENYRSSQSILNISLKVIQEDKKRYQKVLLPVHAKGSQPVLRKLTTSATEGDWIVQEIKRVIMMFGGMIKHEDIAILLRSAALSRHVESALGKAGVAYRMIGGHKFYERKEIKVLIDYLRVVYQPDNNDAVIRIVNVPRRGIGEATSKSLLEEAEQAKMTVWSVLCKHCRGERQAKTNIRAKMEQKLSAELIRIISNLRQKAESITEGSPFTLVNLVEQLISQLNFKRHLEDEFQEDHEQRWANVQEFIQLAGDFMRNFGKADDDELPEVADVEQTKDDNVLGKFLANISLASDAQKDDGEHDKSSLVTISTIHAAKGLEWPVVFVPSVYNGSIPHSRSEDLEEERRLLYVAMTRAQAFLYLSCPMYGQQGTGGKLELSDFVAPFASKSLAPKGPSFGHNVVQITGKILGREVPSQKTIFEKLPPMFSTEDDRHPIDPFDRKNPDGGELGQQDQYERPNKRKRTDQMRQGNDDAVDWKREYETTMEQSSDFTIPSLPGFVSAGAHQHTIDAANAEKVAAKKPVAKKSTNRRPVDQKSLLGFVTQGIKHQVTMPAAPKPSPMSSHGRYQAAAARSAARTAASNTSGIEPQFAAHKLPTGKSLPRPNAPKPTDDLPRKQYTCFSSSPPKPSSPEKAHGDQGTEEKVADKPFSSFHRTTFTSVGPQSGGIRRPVGLGPPPTMDRLRKPFKPLTINRPGAPRK